MNVGPFELLVLAVVGLIVLGPEKLPGLAKDAARMLRTLRELSTGAKLQLREQLGPEFADVDLASLNPRTALSNFLLGGDEANGGTSMPNLNMNNLPSSPRAAIESFMSGGDKSAAAASNGPAESTPVQLTKPVPLGRNEQAPFDSDAT
jgi:sec-independent protein translocase protein TatB